MVAMITRRVTMTDRPAAIAIGPAILARGDRVILVPPIDPVSQCGDDSTLDAVWRHVVGGDTETGQGKTLLRSAG